MLIFFIFVVVFLIFELNVTLCATVFKHMCFYKKKGADHFGGLCRRGKCVTAMQGCVFLFFVFFDTRFSPASASVFGFWCNIRCYVKPLGQVGSFLCFPLPGLSVTPL